jgi:hypothetical protein
MDYCHRLSVCHIASRTVGAVPLAAPLIETIASDFRLICSVLGYVSSTLPLDGVSNGKWRKRAVSLVNRRLGLGQIQNFRR